MFPRLLLAATAWLLAAITAQAAPTACAAPEETLFSCSTGRKLLAVCASPGWSAQAGWLQYRYGPPDAAELVLPAARATPPAASASAGQHTLAGGGAATLRFSSGATDYLVYTAISASLGEQAGVAVLRRGQPLAAVRCRGPVQSQLGPDLFERAGFGRDASEFVLP